MRNKVARVFSVVLVLALLLPMAVSGQTRDTTGPEGVRQSPQRELRMIPEEILAEFNGGLTVEEFLARIDGPIPKALESYADTPVTVVVQLEQEPLAALYAAEEQSGQRMDVAVQRSYIQELETTQAGIVSQLRALGGKVISQYTKAYNGIMVRIPAREIQAIREISGVKAVRRAPLHTVSLKNSAPIVRADEVWNTLGFTGVGVTIAIIDTGIDYTHAAFGGSGNPADFNANDPDIIEPGTFPTAKVIGGYDFAGTNYDASGNYGSTVPTPDDDPLDERGHGTHVASIAAGFEVPGSIGSGMAPGAFLYALKVFGANGSTNLTVDAIEWAMDPNGDDDLSDHVDIINMSLGSPFGTADPNDPDIVASDMASQIGIVVVASAGNEGDTEYITGSPAVADSVISVAATTTGFETGPTVTVESTGDAYIYYPGSFDGGTGHFTAAITATLAYVGNYTTTNTLCTPGGLTPGALNGKVALISRGDCSFSSKINNAASLGAVAALIYNNKDGAVTMAGDPVTIPGGFLKQAAGNALIPMDGEVVMISAENQVVTLPSDTPPDTIASFSSRGPRGVDSYLKPDLAAPGVAIWAASMGSGIDGASYSGTSMAAPMVAGIAALIRQAHPTWNPEWIKAALMNTAVDLADPDSAQLPRQGAGRVDAYAAIQTAGLAIGDDGVISLNWGVVPIGLDFFADTKAIDVYNLSAGIEYYNVGWEFGPGSYTAGVNLEVPAMIFVLPGTSVPLPVRLTIDPSVFGTTYDGVLEEVYGYVLITETVSLDVIRVPFYVVPRPYSDITIVDYGFYTSSDGYAQLVHSGPITSSLYAYPVVSFDPQDGVGAEGDVRLVGMTGGMGLGAFGENLVIPAFSTYGPWHNPQPYFVEMDLYIDADGDGGTDFIDFNFNTGWFSGKDSTNDWIPIRYDLSAGTLSLASIYYIYTDYNSGFMEWYLPTYLDLTPYGWGVYATVFDPADTDMDFFLVGWDTTGYPDIGGEWYYDIAQQPTYTVVWGDDPGPANRVGELFYGLNSVTGNCATSPIGAMVVDYHGKPGKGEVHFLPFEFGCYQMYLPITIR